MIIRNKKVFESQLHYWTHMLDEAFPDEAMLAEGKHWPEDYIKAAVNKLKSSGKYSGSKTDADVAAIAQRFKPKFHTNSALGYFNSIVRWYSEDPEDFIKSKHSDGAQPEDKLEKALTYLKQFLNTQDLVQKNGEKVKSNMDLADFSSMMKKVSDEDRARADNMKFKVEDKGYKIISFMSYEDLHEKFGDDKTGYRGRSEWCHTNGQSTYESWTENYTKFFFVIAKDGWQDIEPHANPQRDDNAYDEYGLSLIAILVSDKGELLKCTLRWNHVVEPKYTKPGREVDRAFISFAELSQVVGFDVEAEVKRQLAEILEKMKKIPKDKKVYEGLEGICFARDHFYWYDRDFNPISAPDKIRFSIDCYRTNITSLEGCPRIIGGGFCCQYTKITSLEGGPEEVGEYFDCSHTSITSLGGSPKKVGGYFDCSQTNITSLEGSPEEVGGFFDCTNTSITSLEGCPKKVGGSFWCQNLNITSLEGGPEEVGESFGCTNTKITSLEGSPREVGDRFWCRNTNIASLKGAPAKIGDIKFSRFSASISAQQLDAYKDWLKTNPKENYPG